MMKVIESCSDNIKINSDNVNWMEWNNSSLDSAKKIADESEHGKIINACYNLEFMNQLN